MPGISIIAIALLYKICHMANILVLSRLLNNEVGATMLWYIAGFITLVFVYGLAIKKYAPPHWQKWSWVPIVALLQLMMFVDPFLILVGLGGLFYYALIALEGSVLRSLSTLDVNRFVLTFVAALPAALYLFVPDARFTEPFTLYAVSTLLAFFASLSDASVKNEDGSAPEKRTPPFLSSVLFAGVSAGIYYVGTLNGVSLPPEASRMILAFVFLFYIASAMIVLRSFDAYLRHRVAEGAGGTREAE
ncbi:MAG: hypothetical protein RL681_232 [Candidatus Parcubacteria bacterium]|jgi:hypothetical protein